MFASYERHRPEETPLYGIVATNYAYPASPSFSPGSKPTAARCLADLTSPYLQYPTRFVLARYAAYGCCGCRIELRH
jgi:hypothetical protein